MKLKPAHPEDWVEKSINSIATIIGGGTPSTANSSYWNGSIPWFTPTELCDTCKYVTKSERTITEDALKNSAAKLLPSGTILLTTRATIGLRAILKVPSATNQGFQSLVVHNNIDNQFIYYLLALIQPELIKQASGSTFLEISPKKLGEISLYLPNNFAEQTAITSVLSDVDDLLSSLDALIAKKRDMKKAAMQELLTGKIRLAGFSGLWERKSINELGIFKSGNGFPLLLQGNSYGDIPFYKVSDMNNIPNINFLTISNNYINKNISDRYKFSIMPKGSIVFAKIGAAIFLERKKVLKYDSCIDNNMCAFIPYKNAINNIFALYIFQNIQLGDLVSTTALPALSSFDLNSIELFVPISDTEQAAIAAVLSDMDAEIAALEARRAKVRDIKTGMMQELLTGRTRLVPTGGPHGQASLRT